jgi:hypothetical protein
VTPQSWEKLGRVWVASGDLPWARTHATLPTSKMLDEERIRVFVACLDEAKVGRVGYVDVAARDPRQVLAVAERPALDVGAPGTFDDNGVNPLWLVEHEGRLYLYYVGWQLGTRVRYYLFCGLAVSEDGGQSFARVSQAPLLDRTDGELFVRTAPCVRCEDGVWKMWYIGGDSWVEGRGKQLPRYGLRYLESDDPRCWRGPGRLVMDVRGGDEHGFGRPFVVRDAVENGGRYRMWYSVRTISAGYRLGYAESPDGLEWKRMDEAVGIGPSAAGWDSEMVCYSFLQPTRYGTYLFYNGNDYGATGFGVAVQR